MHTHSNSKHCYYDFIAAIFFKINKPEIDAKDNIIIVIGGYLAVSPGGVCKHPFHREQWFVKRHKRFTTR